jgi:5-methylcytosine-specific restriction endonuclease McrA
MLKDDILLLRDSGLSYNEIASRLNCSKGVISYHLGLGQKEKSKNRRIKNKQNEHPFTKKIERFSRSYLFDLVENSNRELSKSLNARIVKFSRMSRQKYNTPTFTLEDLLDKIGDNPICYLTGKPIDISQTRSYHFDHKIPRGKGGDNSLENLGLCTAEANQAKSNLTVEEFYHLCKNIVEHLKPQFE